MATGRRVVFRGGHVVVEVDENLREQVLRVEIAAVAAPAAVGTSAAAASLALLPRRVKTLQSPLSLLEPRDQRKDILHVAVMRLAMSSYAGRLTPAAEEQEAALVNGIVW